MKKLWILALMVFLGACNNSASVSIYTDTVENKIDTLGDKAEDKAERLWDTTKADLKEAGKNIKEKVKEGLDKVEVNIKTDTTRKQ